MLYASNHPLYLFQIGPHSCTAMASTHDIVAEAYEVLKTIKEVQFPNRPVYLHPHKFLSALLHHAPIFEGKLEIARDVLAASPDDVLILIAARTARCATACTALSARWSITAGV